VSVDIHHPLFSLQLGSSNHIHVTVTSMHWSSLCTLHTQITSQVHSYN